MGSFKFKLVLWFALLALLPLAIAFYGYDSLAKRSETRRADAALQAGLRGAVAGYAARLDAAGLAAQQLAAEPKVQRALRGHDQRTIKEILSRVPGAHLGNGSRSVSVVYRGRLLGRISVSVPLNELTLQALAGGLEHGDRLVVVRGTRVVAGASGKLDLTAGRAARVRVGPIEYRGLETAKLPAGVALAPLTPQPRIDPAAPASERPNLVALLSTLTPLCIETFLLVHTSVNTR